MKHIGYSRLACSLLVPLLAFGALTAQWRRGPGSKQIKFGGHDWIVKDSSGQRVGPGSNYFSEDAVQVDAQGLKLRVFEKDGRFYCAEVVSTESFGYGTYRFHVASNVDRLASNLTLGLFTWSDDPGEEGTHKELDVELGRWNKDDNDVGQFVVQPYDRPSNILRFSMPSGATESVHSFTWAFQGAHFTSEVAGKQVAEHVFDRRVPVPNSENARINLWIMSGRAPNSGTAEVVISNFEFVPPGK